MYYIKTMKNMNNNLTRATESRKGQTMPVGFAVSSLELDFMPNYGGRMRLRCVSSI